MIVQCGSCSAKLKIADEKLKDTGTKLKCPKCQNIFTVFRPAPEPIEPPAPQPVEVEPPAPPMPEPPPAPEISATPPEEDIVPPPAPEDGEVESARRLARIILSDIALYNPSIVEEGVRTGRFGELLAAELGEGRALYEARVPRDVASRGDFFAEEMEKFVKNLDKKARPL